MNILHATFNSRFHIRLLTSQFKLLLEKLLVGKLTKIKVGSIGQSIIQAVRPRALLATLQVGLGVRMYFTLAKSMY